MRNKLFAMLLAVTLLLGATGCKSKGSDLPQLPDIEIQNQEDVENVLLALEDDGTQIPAVNQPELTTEDIADTDDITEEDEEAEADPDQEDDAVEINTQQELNPEAAAEDLRPDILNGVSSRSGGNLRPSEKVFSQDSNLEFITPFEVSDIVLNSFRDNYPPANSTDKNQITISINCSTAISSGVGRNDGFTHLPKDGWILKPIVVEFSPGDTAFDILAETVIDRGVHMSYRGASPLQYVVAIDNLGEFHGGTGSGWMYSVNGGYPNFGCGQMELMPGDVVEWNYTCNLGEDLGQGWIAGES